MKAALLMLVLGLTAQTGSPTFEITNVSWDVSTFKRSSYVNVTGSITNTSSEPLKSVVVRILYKDAVGTVLNVGKEAVGDVAPGRNVTFKSRTRLVAGMDQFDFEFDGIHKEARIRIPYISKVDASKASSPDTTRAKGGLSAALVDAGPSASPSIDSPPASRRADAPMSEPMGPSGPVIPLLRGDLPRLKSYSHKPPPVEEAVRTGREVWVLQGLDPYFGDGSSHACSTYIILSQGRMERVVVKKEATGATSQLMFDTPGPVTYWIEYPAGRSRTAPSPSGASTSSTILYSWAGVKRGNTIVLKGNLDFDLDSKRVRMVSHEEFGVAIDATWDLGEWRFDGRSAGGIEYKNGLRLPPKEPKFRDEVGEAHRLLPQIPD